MAAFLTEIHAKEELPEAIAWAEQRNLPVIMIGGGSNIVWRDEGFPGLVLVDKIAGFEEREEDERGVNISVGGGEIWDSVVARTAERGLTGIEALSLIPGTAGATPVQNVGAYGQEVSQTISSVEVYDRTAVRFVTLNSADCGFGYRTSRFKTTDRGRFFITSVNFRLLRGNLQPPYYAALEKYLAEHNIVDRTPQTIRDAVIAIRQAKLPDPEKVANNGSFFANPVISKEAFAELRSRYENIPNWPTDDGRIKIPAAWLLDQAGFKNTHDPETGMATWPAQPLVLVNEHAQTTAQLLSFKKKIIDAVQTKFGIILEQEPELLP